MIGLLTGIIAFRNDPYLIIDVHGVGYKVLASPQVLVSSHLSDTVTLFIHTHVREDALDLFAFPTEQDLRVFDYLISVNGIGPKTAMGVFGVGSREEILGAIRKADVDFFTGVPRLGKKNAQKIIIELKNKLGSGEELDLSEGTEEEIEVINALVSMGFSEREARIAVKGIGENGKTVSERVKLALRQLGKR
jgi:Holliday junction DNA helicase RuvA